MKNKIKTLACLLPVVMTTASGMASAQEATITPAAMTTQDNAQERINYAGKLRMLSQQIPAAACHLNQAIATDAAASVLTTAVAEFEAILSALEFGNADLNINAPETRRKSLAAIHELRAQWQPLQAAAVAMTNANATEADINYVLTENLPVLAAAQRTLEELTEQYSNPNAVTRASMMMIDISSRQLMLTQQLSKDTCILASAPAAEDDRGNLETTVGIFEASLEALRFGMPAVGIGAPPNAQISEGLEAVVNEWSTVQPMIASVVAGETLDPATSAQKFERLNATMNQMDAVVAMYVAAAAPSE